MKKRIRIIAAVLAGAILLQSSVLADGLPVIIEQVAGEDSTVIYQGDITDFNAFSIPWGKEDHNFDYGIIFDWDKEDGSYYTVTPTALDPVPNKPMGVQNNPVSTPEPNDFSHQLVPGFNLDSISLQQEIVLPREASAAGLAEINIPEEAAAPLAAVPEAAMDQSNQTLASRAARDALNATSFNTITAPAAANSLNAPRYSAAERMAEEVSPYSGELTIRTNDLSLAGRNGLDLNIGRIYQTAQANMGQMRYMGIPTEGEGIHTTGVWDVSNYYLDRYNLGVGWAFNFPSVQVETEWEYDVDEDLDPYLREYTELYYHTGDGTVYQVEFTSDPQDSNLKGYPKKDIQFNQSDTGYSNGAMTSYYSLTLADQTKQYFAKDGRLLGIQDRFGNTIKFEHAMQTTANSIPNGTFAYDNEMWELSDERDFLYNYDFGRYDDRSIQFNRATDRAYLRSQPVQVEPGTEYELTLSLNSKFDDTVKIEIEEYDWNYTWFNTIRHTVTDLPEAEWTERTFTITPDYFTRYIRVRIAVEGGTKELYVDNVQFDTPKPLISEITDTIGRTIEFTYSGNILEKADGGVTIDVTAPDGKTKKLAYEKQVVEYITDFVGEDDQRLYWYLSSADVEGETKNGVSTSKATYRYNGGMDENGNYRKLHTEYNSKTLNRPNSYYNKPVLDQIKYRNRTTNFEYAQTRKNLGTQGFYDSLRVTKRYEQTAQTDGTKIWYAGELNRIDYSYGGIYNGTSYTDETGYPDYTFTGETELGEQWTSIAQSRDGKQILSNTYTNGALAESRLEDMENDTATVTAYTYHDSFQTEPVQKTTTIEDENGSKVTCARMTYTDWGGLESETKDVPAEIFNHADRLAFYTTWYTYDDTYKMITEKQFYNRENGPQYAETAVYDDLGRLQSTTDAAGKTITYAYENTAYPGNLTKETVADPQGLHQLLGEARTVEYQYDSYGLYPSTVTENFDDQEKQTAYTYDYIYGNPLQQVNPDGGVIQNTYDSQGRLFQSRQPLVQDNGKVFCYIDQYEYTPRMYFPQYGQSLYFTEKISRFAYYPATGEAPVCTTEQNFYNNAGNLELSMVTDRSRVVDDNIYLTILTSYTYDNTDRLIQVTDCDHQTVQYAYDPTDRLTKITDPQGTQYIYVYDDSGSSITVYMQDAGGAQQNHLTEQHDIWGNVLSRTVYPDGPAQPAISEYYAYDIAGNVTAKTDPNGNTTQYEYDGLNRLTKTILPDGTSAAATYSYFDQPVSEKLYDADGQLRYTRTALGNEKGDITAKFYAWGNRLMDNNSYAYSAKGNMEQSQTGGYTYTYDYDYADNVLTKTSAGSAVETRYGKFGREIAVAPDGSVTGLLYGYDAMGRITAKSQSNYQASAQFQYTPKDQLAQVTSPFGTTVNYGYDENDRLTTVSTAQGNYSYTYYADGLIQSVVYPNGITTWYTYDNANRVQSMKTKKGDVMISDLAYTYDNNGNVLTETRDGKTTVYTYDSLNRLKTACYGGGSTVAYTYDATGNRIGEAYSNGDIREYEYDGCNRLLAVKQNGQVTDTYEYNANGSVTKHNDTVYTYDLWGSLESVAKSGNLWYYKYDADGIRTGKTGTQYFVDLNGNVISEAGDDGQAQAEIVYGNRALARKADGQWYYYLYNAHGDVIGLADAAGNIVNSYEYDAWGNILDMTEAVENPIRYAGQYYDAELGQYYLRARYYDPAVGRFTSIDAVEGDITNPLDWNQYVYCKNNPVKC